MNSENHTPASAPRDPDEINLLEYIYVTEWPRIGADLRG